MKKKMMSLALAVVMCLSLCVPAFAVENVKVASSESQLISEERLNQILGAVVRDTGESKVESGKSKTVVVKGFASGQGTNGFKFNSKNYSGATLYYSSTGGQSQSVSISFSSPYVPVSISIDMGVASSDNVGVGLSVNSGYGYYKVYVEKTVTVTPYAVYYRVGPGAPWECVNHYHTETVDNQFPYLKKVASL